MCVIVPTKAQEGKWCFWKIFRNAKKATQGSLFARKPAGKASD
jgi:hypothetical protein